MKTTKLATVHAIHAQHDTTRHDTTRHILAHTCPIRCRTMHKRSSII